MEQGSKEGKTAWKIRKQALEEIEAGLKGCSGLIETDPSRIKALVELTRGLRDRLSDTQINLRPIAARIVGSLLSAVDRSCQAKLGKLVFASLINAAMNDIKKPFRDASLAAIRAGIMTSELDGGGLNELSLENFVGALVVEVNESATRVRPTGTLKAPQCCTGTFAHSRSRSVFHRPVDYQKFCSYCYRSLNTYRIWTASFQHEANLSAKSMLLFL